MAFTSADLQAVDAAIASGELSVEINGRKVVYRGMDDLERARRLIESELAAAAPGVRRGSYRVQFSTARGD